MIVDKRDLSIDFWSVALADAIFFFYRTSSSVCPLCPTINMVDAYLWLLSLLEESFL